ncbi:serine hydrolase [Rhodococcus sp. 14-1411-2a]|nr:serine hydrolase [Rhodococcus sp. 14-1411-2a]
MMRSGRNFLCLAVVCSMVVLVGCSNDTPAAESPPTSEPAPPSDLSPGQVAGVDVPTGRVDEAVGKLDGIAEELMASSNIPGMAIAVVHGSDVVYSKGFGVREVGENDPVDGDSVFQLASLSKSVGATVIASQVGAGVVDWSTPVVSQLPWFALDDPWVTENITVGDFYAHRSGLPEHAGDLLEDLGYDRRQVLERLREVPLDPFRSTYHYTNFGITAAAEAVAAASGEDWDTLSHDTIYGPLGMTSTSSSFADYIARADRAVPHVLVDGEYQAKYQREPDAQTPAGGVNSSVNDLAKWLRMLVTDGTHDGREIVDPDALLPAVSAQIMSSPSATPDSRSGYYGYGFNVSTSAAGRTTVSHSGAFALGAGTNFLWIPSLDVAIVVLTNAAPLGIAETVTAEFADLVQFGEVREDWRTLYKNAFAGMSEPEGELAGKTAPANPTAPQPLASYTGVYQNSYWGPATVAEVNGELLLSLGPNSTSYELSPWDGDTFTFEPTGENAPDGTISQATFDANTLTLEFFDGDGLGRFTK